MEKLVNQGIELLPVILWSGVVILLFFAVRDSKTHWRTFKKSNSTWKEWWRALGNLALHWFAVLIALSGALLSDQANAIMERKVERLESTARARTITPQQRTNIIECLAHRGPKGKVRMIASILDEESTAYAKDIENILVNCGFEVEPPARGPNGELLGNSTLFLYGGDGSGLEIQFAKEWLRKPHYGGSIQRCFADQGINMIAKLATIETNIVVIVVARKPLLR